jgi:hypothetical protein
MTKKFAHQQRSGRRRKAKARRRQGLGIRSIEQLVAHRELAYLRNPTSERLRKLEDARRKLSR